MCFLPAWSLESQEVTACFVHLLLCVYHLDCQQIARRKGGQAASCWPAVAALHQQLRYAAVQLACSDEAMAPMMVPRMCAASAAAGMLMRMCGDIQVVPSPQSLNTLSGTPTTGVHNKHNALLHPSFPYHPITHVSTVECMERMR